jgi:adenine-specific DNA-methyltransferase
MQGIISGADHLTQNHLEKYPRLEQDEHKVGEGIFCVSPTTHPALFASTNCRPFLKPYFKGRHIQTQAISGPDGQPSMQFPNQDFLLYLPHHLDTPPPDTILNHLEPYRPILEARREVQQGKIPWYALHWPRNERRLNGISLVTPRRSHVNRFALSPEGWFAHSDLTVLGLKDTPDASESDYLSWITLLNSPLLNAWINFRGKAKGKIREYYATPLRQIPLPNANAMKQCPFPLTHLSPEEAHQWVCQCYGLSNTEAQFVWDGWQAFKKN